MSVYIISDSACDLTQAEALERNVKVIPLTVRFGDTEYLDGITLDHDLFFNKLIETDTLPVTSQATPYMFEEAFRPICENGNEVVCLTISSKLSGCYESACKAAELFPGKVQVVDSLNACIGQRILVELAARLRNEGRSAKEIAEILNKRVNDVRLIALLDTLEYLKKGGRISKAVALAGAILSVKPVVEVRDGNVVMKGKARGSKAARNLLTQMIEQEGPICMDMPYCLGYSGLSDVLLRKYIEDSAELYAGVPQEELPICSIGSVIGTHVGPGAIALAFFVKGNS